MKANRFHTLALSVALIFGAGLASAQDLTPASPAAEPSAAVQSPAIPQAAAPVTPASPVSAQVNVTEQTQALPPAVSGTRQTDVNVTDHTVDTAAPSTSSTNYTVFGMDSTAGVMIGIVLMLVFVLAIVAVSRNETTTVV